MSDDRFQPEILHSPLPDIIRTRPLLPEWLDRHFLRTCEKVLWVRGPRRNPWWERYVTHPTLFLYALAGAAVCLTVGRLCVESWRDVHPLPVVAAFVLVVGAVYVLVVAAAYFTRLVVTDTRLVILQGYEECRSWDMKQLPPSLLRYRKRAGAEESRAIDLGALQTMLGGATDQFADAKSILTFGKQLDQIKIRKDGKPSSD